MNSSPAITLGPSAWPDIAGHAPTNETKRRFRAELGLPTAGPVVLSGHQPTLWHPGILAKAAASAASAALAGGEHAWICVDHDAVNPGEVRFPVRNADGRLASGVHSFAPIAGLTHDTPACSRDAFEPRAFRLPAGSMVEPVGVADALARMEQAFHRHAGSPTAAEQIAGVTRDLLPDGVTLGTTVFASRLQQTEVFRRVVDEARRDPRACAESYNRAIEANPKAGIRALRIGDEIELPFWSLREGAARVRVTSATLDGCDSLAPRAILMTPLLRLAGCELFVHGLGGGEYERIGEAWIRSWLGDASGLDAPAPYAVVSADLRLQFAAGAPPTDEDVALARWRAHHARHAPELLGDSDAGHRARTIASEIELLPRGDAERARLFRELHRLLEDVRATRSTELDALGRAATELVERAKDRDVMLDRAWPFPLYEREALGGLWSVIGDRVQSLAGGS